MCDWSDEDMGRLVERVDILENNLARQSEMIDTLAKNVEILQTIIQGHLDNYER